MGIGDEKYVATTTFRKSGTVVPTATWIVPLEAGRVGFLTSSVSGKYKRLRNNPRVTLQPSDIRGNVKAGTTAVEGTVQLVTSGPDFHAVETKTRAKYGFMVSLSKFFYTLAHLGKGPYPHADVAVIVTLLDGN